MDLSIIIIFSLVFGYGISTGFRNTAFRIKCMFSDDRFSQNSVGYILDSLFYAGITYLTIKGF
jgi:hypothetical protein